MSDDLQMKRLIEVVADLCQQTADLIKWRLEIASIRAGEGPYLQSKVVALHEASEELKRMLL